MGLKFKDIVISKELSYKHLSGKILAIDTMNLLYQFLTTIRSIDGSPLTHEGKVTSHLIGLFNRTTTLMEHQLKLAFVFDGPAPEIKKQTQKLRKEAKKKASLLLKDATDAQDYSAMKKYASRTVSLTPEMVDDAKLVLQSLGLPIIQAPSEGEAQTAHMVKKGKAYASISQDYDNLIFGCPTLIRNLSIAGKRKKTGTFGYTIVKPEIILLDDVLTNLELTQDQLIVLAILAGTDYNPGGVKGIGPKKGLKLVKTHGDDFENLFKEVKWDFEVSWQEIFETIKNIPTTDEYSLEWGSVDKDKTTRLLVDKFGFSEDRVESKLAKLHSAATVQKGLGSFF